MRWISACSQNNGKQDSLVLVEVSENNTENRKKIIKKNNATYHTNGVKVISVTKYKTKEKLANAYYQGIQFNVGGYVEYENSVLNGECTDKGFEYFLTMKRAMNNIDDNFHDIYYYQGDKFCSFNITNLR